MEYNHSAINIPFIGAGCEYFPIGSSENFHMKAGDWISIILYGNKRVCVLSYSLIKCRLDWKLRGCLLWTWQYHLWKNNIFLFSFYFLFLFWNEWISMLNDFHSLQRRIPEHKHIHILAHFVVCSILIVLICKVWWGHMASIYDSMCSTCMSYYGNPYSCSSCFWLYFLTHSSWKCICAYSVLWLEMPWCYFKAPGYRYPQCW